MYDYMDFHFGAIEEDRLTLLQAYQILHDVIPTMSPLSGTFFADIFKKLKKPSRVKYRNSELLKEQSGIRESDPQTRKENWEPFLLHRLDVDDAMI